MVCIVRVIKIVSNNCISRTFPVKSNMQISDTDLQRHEIHTSLTLLITRTDGLILHSVIQSDSLARSPKLVYLQIFNEFVNQLMDNKLTTGYYQQDGATCHTSNASMREIESFLKTELPHKSFGHPDLPI